MSDPLEPFRVRPRQAEPEASEPPELTEHQALKLAIEALNEAPNHRLRNEYKTTYALLPQLEKVYRAGEERAKLLAAPAPHAPMTDAEMDAAVAHDLKLWEEAQKERTQARDIEPERLKAMNAELLKAARQVADRLERLADLDKEAGYHPSAEAHLEMAGVLRDAIAKATPEPKPVREPSTPEPERDIDLER